MDPSTPPHLQPPPISPPLPPPWHGRGFEEDEWTRVHVGSVWILLAMMIFFGSHLRAKLRMEQAQRRIQKQQQEIVASVQHLPTRTVTPAETDGDNECSICLGAFEVGETIKTLPCKHEFHVECIDHWLLPRAQGSESRLPVCPLCKDCVIGWQARAQEEATAAPARAATAPGFPPQPREQQQPVVVNSEVAPDGSSSSSSSSSSSGGGGSGGDDLPRRPASGSSRSRVVPCTERESDGSQGIDLEAGGRNREQDAPGSQSERAPAVPRASMFGMMRMPWDTA